MGGGIVQIRIPEPVPDGVNVFETMRAEPDGRILLWSLHLARLRRGCAALGFPLDEEQVADVLATVPHGAVRRVRLAVDRTGHLTLTHAGLPPNPPVWRVVLSDLRLNPADPWLQIKTTHRPIYDAARAALPVGIDEALLRNADDQVCEGAITSIFLRRGAALLTPPLSSGLLPGILRQSLLAQGRARETILRSDDLSKGALFCGNALRGLIPAVLV